ncbi:LCP family protein [Leucobacter ruminantium]|uniref:LCP family protein n=1 Tax=Leucobacter ruminantium TaxID=1289170 RepID=A0A939RZ70_9MICO|nr:LCP family protein [Leucobacter ruminantium]MBO1805566.1 LCP family protein [Leucobacter ruminantium]
MSKNREHGVSSRFRHGRLRRSSSWGNALRVLITGALVVGLSGVATVAYAVWGLAQNVNTVSLGGSAPGVDAVDLSSQSLDGPLTVLLVGSDTRAGQSLDDGETGELNDVNLLLHVSADHENATVISFPRDLMVPIPSCPGPNGEPDYTPAMSEQQINTTLGVGGLPCVAATISELTGMEIPYAGMVTFDGVIQMSNAIGGVEVCLTQPIDDPYTGLELPAGMNTLSGGQALQFLRTRHGVGDGGDTSRISNQQVFMSAMMRQLKSSNTLGDPMKVYGLAKAIVENMTLSDNMANVPFMQAAAGTVKDIDLSRINFVQYPTTTHPYEAGRLTPDSASAQALIDAVVSGQPFNVTAVGEGVAADGTAETADPSAEPQVDPETGLPIDPATGWPIDPATGWPIDPATGQPVDPATIPPTETPAADPNAPVELPSNITGQRADQQTCSQGRTVF